MGKDYVRKHNLKLKFINTTKDDPSVADEIEVAVAKGEIVVAGTDGLLDNVHASEIVEVVGKLSEQNGLAEQACYMANLALYNSFDRFTESPFSRAAKAAGRCHKGGKVDDITVIIARIDQD